MLKSIPPHFEVSLCSSFFFTLPEWQTVFLKLACYTVSCDGTKVTNFVVKATRETDSVFLPFATLRAGAVGFLLYFFVAEASLIPSVGHGANVHKAAGGASTSVVWNTYRAVHLTIGLVIMVPILVVAFFPFMTHFQVPSRELIRSFPDCYMSFSYAARVLL